MVDLEGARRRWLLEKAEFERFGKELEGRLSLKLRSVGIWAEVSSRPKEVDSFIRKLIKKPNLDYETVGDKCGVRVIVRYKSEVDRALELVSDLLDCAEPEKKADLLDPDQVGYLSAHVDVRLRKSDPKSTSYPPDKFRAELQVRTMAQHLWSEMSHSPFYKNDRKANPFPKPFERRIFLLAGVVEVADNEFDRLHAEMPTIPEMSLLKSLERHYYKLTTRHGDPEVTIDLIRLFLPLYHGEVNQIAAHLDKFIAENEEVIRDVYEQADHQVDRSAYLYQPETLMIYDRLCVDQLAVRKVWNSQYPEIELERIANAFGISFD